MGDRKRRSWSDDEKRSICLQTQAAGVSVAQVGRRYAMNANQIFNWLKDERFAPPPENPPVDTAVFLPVEVCSEPPVQCLPSVAEPAPTGRTNRRLEITLCGGHRLTVEGDFDGAELARLLRGLVS